MKLGCGLFGLAMELGGDFWGTMQKLADIGFTAVEPLYAFKGDAALQPDSPVPSFLKTILWNEEKVKEYLPQLREMGLEISSMHAGFLFGTPVESGCEELLGFAERTGITRFMTSLEFDTMEKTESAIRLMNKAKEIMDGTGVTLGYHNHYMEFLPADDTGTFMDYFLKNTDEQISLQLDVGWQMYGGSDVPAFMKKYPERICSVHLKDFIKGFAEVPKDDAFAAIGDGALPTKEVLELLPRLNLMEHGLMIDQDQPAKGKVLSEDLKRGAEYILRRELCSVPHGGRRCRECHVFTDVRRKEE